MTRDARKVVATVFLLLFLAAVLYGASAASDDCARRSCPEGTKPKIVRYQGCVCIGKPK